MPDINSITSGSQYLGNKELGGYIPDGFEIDMKPVEKLAAYTYLQNKSYYDQRQEDAAAAMKELSNLAEFDAVGSLPQYKEQGIKLAEEVRAKAESILRNPPRTPQERIAKTYELKKLKSDGVAQIKALNEKNISYNKQIKDIDENKDTLEPTKQRLRDHVAKTFSTVKWDDATPNELKYTVALPKVGNAITTDVETNVKDANGNYHLTYSNVFDPSATERQSIAEAEGLKNDRKPNPTPNEQLQYDLEDLGGGQKVLFDNAAKNYAEIVGKYKITDANGKETIDFAAIKRDHPKDIGMLVEGIEKFNEYNRNELEKVKNNVYNSKGASPLTSNNFFQIDPTEPLSPSNLLTIQKYLNWGAMKKQEDYKYTGEGNTRRDMDLDFKVAWHNANKPSGGTNAVPDAINKPATLFGQHVDTLKNIFSKDPNKKTYTIAYSVTDPTTRAATGMEENEVIVYDRNGGYSIQGTDGKVRTVGTIENLSQGFIDAVKTIDGAGSDKDGSMAEGFQTKSENYFKQLWGTSSGKVIWDNWGTQQKETTVGEVITVGNKQFKLPPKK